ncbi:MAG: LysR family transcriptional regulator [Gammaproteobacteria bacterium]|nr:LysR family transcriptional regulator [Gammaproteobacteria bacterium]
MQVFISVADSGSFSKSTRQPGLSQPSVSRQVNTLEEHLGIRLLQRTTRRLSLTEAGQIYYDKARQIQKDVIEASQSISGFKEKPSGLLKIGAPYNFTEAKIVPHLSEFLQKHPDIKLDIECNDKLQDIVEDQLDLVIRIGELTDSSYVATTFGKVRMIMCATPQYLEQQSLPKTLSDLQNHNFILYENFKHLLLTDSAGTQQVSISGSFSSNIDTVMLAAVLQHIGITVLPDIFIKQQIEEGKLVDIMLDVEISVKNLPIHHVFALYSNRKNLPAKTRAFPNFFRDKFS